MSNLQGDGAQAAAQFYRLLQARNPMTRARLREIIDLASRGDPEAIRAVRLIQSAMGSPVQVGAAPTTEQIETLRQVLIQARYAPAPTGQQTGPGPIPVNSGTYQVSKTGGLSVYAAPNTLSPIQTLQRETLVTVVDSPINGWLKIMTPVAGYVCLSCPEIPGGPWLIRKS